MDLLVQPDHEKNIQCDRTVAVVKMFCTDRVRLLKLSLATIALRHSHTHTQFQAPLHISSPAGTARSNQKIVVLAAEVMPFTVPGSTCIESLDLRNVFLLLNARTCTRLPVQAWAQYIPERLILHWPVFWSKYARARFSLCALKFPRVILKWPPYNLLWCIMKISEVYPQETDHWWSLVAFQPFVQRLHRPGASKKAGHCCNPLVDVTR